VNSVRKRTGNLVDWLKIAKPDVVVLQELKAQESQFPRLEVEAAGPSADPTVRPARCSTGSWRTSSSILPDVVLGRDRALWSTAAHSAIATGQRLRCAVSAEEAFVERGQRQSSE
jgi:hypothetical protein